MANLPVGILPASDATSVPFREAGFVWFLLCTVKGVLGWGYTQINALFKFHVFFIQRKEGGELCEDSSPFLWCEVWLLSCP